MVSYISKLSIETAIYYISSLNKSKTININIKQMHQIN